MSLPSETVRPSLAHSPGDGAPVRVLVPCTVDERHQARALEAYRELVDATRREAGCLSYELLQCVDDSTRFLLVEEWASQDHLDAHTRTEHFVRLVAQLEQLERAAPAELYRRVL
ncbi:putative quinol monooxygenase [Oerskovia sp. NPDC056781]|uniref:putative quinol monooxygenase n=1 Tax=Oerskovia sp. NPDC056781 TaxID=3345942 RepID=UPI003672188D